MSRGSALTRCGLLCAGHTLRPVTTHARPNSCRLCCTRCVVERRCPLFAVAHNATVGVSCSPAGSVRHACVKLDRCDEAGRGVQALDSSRVHRQDDWKGKQSAALHITRCLSNGSHDFGCRFISFHIWEGFTHEERPPVRGKTTRGKIIRPRKDHSYEGRPLFKIHTYRSSSFQFHFRSLTRLHPGRDG